MENDRSEDVLVASMDKIDMATRGKLGYSSALFFQNEEILSSESVLFQ